jgi:hypothetical protein
MARQVGAQAEIRGLVQFQRELRRLDKTLPRELRGINLEAAELVAGKARARALALGGVHAHVAPGIKAAAEQRRAKIAFDVRRQPAILGAEFGSIQHRQFPGWTGNRWTDPEGLDVGYMAHPAAREVVRSGELVELYGDLIERLASRAFPD